MWQDVAKTTPVTTIGDPIAYWEDKSGNGNDWTQSDNSRRPTWQGDSVRFQNDWLIGPNLSGYSTGTFAARVETVDAGGFSAGGWFHICNLNNSGSATHWGWGTGTHYEIFCSTSRYGASTWGSYAIAFPGQGIAPDADITYLVTRTAGSSNEIYINANNVNTTATGTGNLGTAPIIGGSRRNSVISTYSIVDGYIKGGGFVLYDRHMDSSEVSEIDAFLMGE